MRRSEDPHARAAMADLDCLEDDHRRCEACQTVVDLVVRGWLETGRLDEVRRRRLRAALGELANVYAGHIQMEEQRVFPLASHILEPDQIREIGEEMRERRSLTRSESTI